MRSTILSVLAVLLAAGAAYGRAPTFEELPTVKLLQNQAEEAIAAAREAVVRAARNPEKEAIQAYALGHVALKEFGRVVDILLDDKQDLDRRREAADALRTRFARIAASDPSTEREKKKIGRAIVGLLAANDQEVRTIAHNVLHDFWRGQSRNIGFKPNGSYRERFKAARDWKKFLLGR